LFAAVSELNLPGNEADQSRRHKTGGSQQQPQADAPWLRFALEPLPTNRAAIGTP
jgi:hypothetical protein